VRPRKIGSRDGGAVARYVAQTQVGPGEHSENLGRVDGTRVDAGDAGMGLGAAYEGEMNRTRWRQVGYIAT
jgi:hypothetical protein